MSSKHRYLEVVASEQEGIIRRQFLAQLGLSASAAIGIAHCGCRQTPITHRRQLTLVPETQEQQMGLTAFEDIRKKNTLSTNQTYTEIVERVGKRLAAVSERGDYAWEFAVIADKTQNAFCLPGGKVAFYEGIIPVCANEAGVAVVMSHEISHALARHGGERMSQQMVEEKVGTGGIALAKYLGVKMTAEQEKLALNAYNVGAEYGVMLPFSRFHETEADEMGIHLMAKAGYDPNEAPKFWQRFSGAKKGGSQTPWYASTHPSDETRAENLAKLLPEALGEYEAAATKYGVGVTVS